MFYNIWCRNKIFIQFQHVFDFKFFDFKFSKCLRLIIEKMINKIKLIVKSSFKLEWIDLIRLANRKSRLEFELESNSNSWHAKRFELESSFKSKRQNLIWIWFKFQTSMSNLIWFVKSFNFMTYYIISRYF